MKASCMSLQCQRRSSRIHPYGHTHLTIAQVRTVKSHPVQMVCMRLNWKYLTKQVEKVGNFTVDMESVYC